MLDLTRDPPRDPAAGPDHGGRDLARCSGASRVRRGRDPLATDRTAHEPRADGDPLRPPDAGPSALTSREHSRDLAWPRAVRADRRWARTTLPAASRVAHRIDVDLTTPEIAARDLYVVLHRCDALGLRPDRRRPAARPARVARRPRPPLAGHACRSRRREWRNASHRTGRDLTGRSLEQPPLVETG